MANKTVYPYGTGGSLPSSIGIINDLTTGGADKALAAEQGKIIGDYLGEGFGGVIENDVDLSLYTTQNYSLGAASTSSNKWVSAGKHKTIPVVPGDVYKLSVTSTEATGGFYGFFTDQFVEPSSTSSDVPYATGETGRRWLNNGSTVVTIPNGAAYLVICPMDGSNHSSTWTVSYQRQRTISDDFVPIEDLDEISESIDEMMEYSLNLDDYTPVRAYPANTNKWVCTDDNYPYYGIFIACEPGQVFELIANTDNSVVRYCFLQNNSYSQSASVAYADGYSGNPAATPNGGASVTAPNNAHYLYIVVSYDGLATTVSPSDVRTIAKTVEEIALAVASTVEEEIPDDPEDEKIPAGLTKYEYSGPLVKVAEKQRYVAVAQVATITAAASQGGACYGDYLFMFTTNNETCRIYNLATSTLVQTITIPSEEKGFVSNCHCNTVNFGTARYDSNDPFPLIYVSTGYASGGYTGALVYRVVATTENDTTTYSLSLVQTLKIPEAPDGSAWTEFVTGDQFDCFIVYSSSNTVYRMPLPALSSGDITFDLDDAWDVYHFPPRLASWNGSRPQNWMHHDGKLYYVSGVPTSQEKSLFIVLNLSTERRDVVIDIKGTFGLGSEPETCFIWDGHFCIAFNNNAKVYALYFE